jgi:hypothetical protein
MFGAATATAIAIKANMIAYSTTVTPFVLLFLFMNFPFQTRPNGVVHPAIRVPDIVKQAT